MKKQYYILFGLCLTSFSVFSQQMVEKKVCNTLENGAEFCTIFKVPASQEKKKTTEEINKELEKESEIVFKEKDEKKAFVPINNSKSQGVKNLLVPPNLDKNKNIDNDDSQIKKNSSVPTVSKNKETKKIKKKRVKEFKPKKITPTVVSPIVENKNESSIQAPKIVESTPNFKKEVVQEVSTKEVISNTPKKEDAVSNVKQKIEVDSVDVKKEVEKPIRKPTLKEKKSFSELLNTIKDLD